jgi:hypothetical protein
VFFLNGMEFIFAGIGISIAVRAIASVRGVRHRDLPRDHRPHPALLEDPRVPHLQAEVEELRTQVERLAATETFYAQLNAPSSGARTAGTPPPPPQRPAG